jgi:hypothetical protein
MDSELQTIFLVDLAGDCLAETAYRRCAARRSTLAIAVCLQAARAPRVHLVRSIPRAGCVRSDTRSRAKQVR